MLHRTAATGYDGIGGIRTAQCQSNAGRGGGLGSCALFRSVDRDGCGRIRRSGVRIGLIHFNEPAQRVGAALAHFACFIRTDGASTGTVVHRRDAAILPGDLRGAVERITAV